MKPQFTGYVMGKCRDGHRVRYWVGPYWFRGYREDGRTLVTREDRIRPCARLGCTRMVNLEHWASFEKAD